MTERRLPPSWSIIESTESFVVIDEKCPVFVEDRTRPEAPAKSRFDPKPTWVATAS
jgi:hypothetical protein